MEIEREKLLSTNRNMAILQILSQKPSLYNEWFVSYDILRQFYCRGRDLGELLAPQRVQPAKTNFLGSFRVFGRILELHFFQFQKKIFSLRPIVQEEDKVSENSIIPVF